MNWFNIFNKKKDSLNEEIILGIVLREEKGEVMLIKKSQDKFQLIDKQSLFYSNAFENLPEDIDQVLSYFEKKGYHKINEVVYFLSGFFFNERGELKDLFFNKLKEINEKLEFESMGYIEIAQVFIYQKEKENGLPLSAIFIEIEKTQFRFILKKAGKKLFERVQSKTDNFLVDVCEIIYDIKEYYPLPIRIIIFDGDNLAKEKESLSNYLYKEECFIHIPRIEILTLDIIEKYLIDCLQSELIAKFFRKKVVQEEKKSEIFGFLIDQDIKEIKRDLLSQKNYQNKENSLLQTKNNLIKEFLSQANKRIILFVKKSLGLVFFFQNSRKRFLFFFLLLILGFLILINEFFFHRIVIRVILPKENLKKEITINETEGKLMSDQIEKLIEKKIVNTGKKEIGEKAQGEVEIYNYTFERKTLSPGTVLTVRGVDYFLKDQVMIASASYIGNQIGNPIQPGKNKGLVIASIIGEEGNQPEATVFLLKNFSQNELFAKSSQSISGGYKKEVTIFSQSDKEKLREQVIEEGKKNFEEKEKTNFILIRPLTEVKLIDENYSKEVGDEAKETILRAKINITRYFLDRNQIKEIFVKEVQKDIPSNYHVEEKSITSSFRKVEEDDGLKTFYFFIEARMMKKIDKEKLKKEIIFIKKDRLKEVLLKNQVTNYQIIKEENLIPIFYNYFPSFSKNIEVIID